ncbi:uncharacterized protein BJX67DRAFT_41301 [Aspergillus lucknowensis]|uniref:Uncharacterized protein n=1 Tax=Aspergillus lucknowensis TaxID=176173 RepID=A0ABR4LVA4_9EURO
MTTEPAPHYAKATAAVSRERHKAVPLLDASSYIKAICNWGQALGENTVVIPHRHRRQGYSLRLEFREERQELDQELYKVGTTTRLQAVTGNSMLGCCQAETLPLIKNQIPNSTGILIITMEKQITRMLICQMTSLHDLKQLNRLLLPIPPPKLPIPN